MPPKPAATTTRRWGRTFPTTARKSVPNSSPTTTTAAKTAVIPPPSAASRESRSIHTSSTGNTPQKSLHTTSPASHTPPQNLQKTLLSTSGCVVSDLGNVDGIKNEESGKPIETEKPDIKQIGPEKTIHVETVTVMGSGGGSECTANLSSVPTISPHLQDGGSVKPVYRPENGADEVVGPGNGKKRIVKKVVRVVKKVIKKRVLKRASMHDPENQELMVKADESEVTKNLTIDDDGIEKSIFVNNVTEKHSIVNETRETSSIADDTDENTNLVNGDVMETSNLVDGVTEKTSIISEVMEESKFTDDMTQKLELVNSAGVSGPIDSKKSNDASGHDSAETETSKLDFGASALEQIIPSYDQSGVNTSDTNNIRSNDVLICVPDSMEAEKVNYISENEMEIEEMTDTVTENQAKDSVVENQGMYIISKADIRLEADRTVGLEGHKNEVLVGQSESAIANEGPILSEEMEKLERKKWRKTEIFVGGLDDCTKEDDIRKVFEEFGAVMEVRLMLSGNTERNRGYAFVRFATAADAKNAAAKYSKVEICGKQCNVEAPVEGNDTILLGNIDIDWMAEDVVMLLEKAGIENIDKVTLKADPDNVKKNRGFAFLEFETSKDAEVAFSKLQKGNAFGKNLMVEVAWAQPLIEPDEEEMLKVKCVYAEYLPTSWNEQKVKEYFKRFGEIENVDLAKDLPSARRKDFAFIYYTKRDAALTCIEAVSRERSEDHGSKVKLAVSLANPNLKSKLMKLTHDQTSKQPPKVKPKAVQISIKVHEPRHVWKPASRCYNGIKVDSKPSTTDELIQILRQQALNKHIHPHPPPHPRTGTNPADIHFPLTGNKRPFSQLGYDPHHAEPQGLSRARVESSYPISFPSSSSRDVDVLPFPYHPQQSRGFTSESVIGWRSYPNHFQERERAPFYGENNLNRRY